MKRRTFLTALAAPAIVTAESERPVATAIQSGDIGATSALVWSRADRASRMLIDIARDERFTKDVRRIVGPHALDVTDFTARHVVDGLAPGTQYFYRVEFEELRMSRAKGAPLEGRFRTAPATRRDVRFFFSGDTAGQGWGINPEWGGMRIYETMRAAAPDFFVHSGDVIYADNPILPEVKLPDGTIWRNVTTPEKSHIAGTLADYRGNYKYNLLDDKYRRFAAEVPQLWQWDDHEVQNNWSPAKDIFRIAAFGSRAFLEYAPMRYSADEIERVYRRIAYGPLLDVFLLDMRSYRGPNSANMQKVESAETAFLGRAQRDWLKRELKNSRALWKVIAADMPIGLVVPDGKDMYEAIANANNGPAQGRELEIADLLGFLKANRIRNIVWITADVHYTAAHRYDPKRARFTNFDPFWEFVSGPLHAGTFGPNPTDDTFGIEVVYQKHPPAGQANLPPSAGMQFYGDIRIEGRSGAMTVVLRDLAGTSLHTEQLTPFAA